MAKQKYEIDRWWTCDFETTTDVGDCRVWGWAACNIQDPAICFVRSDIDKFIDWLEIEQPERIFFRNLKFDGEFLMYGLLRREYKWVEERSKLKSNTFCTLLSDKNVFYTIDICWCIEGKKKIRTLVVDSLKIIPLSIDETPKAFGLEENKLSINYDKYREVGYIPTPHEEEYIKHDVIIDAKALKYFFDINMFEITIGSNSLKFYKALIGYDKFDRWFPVIECDSDIRLAYRGGWTYLNPKYAGKDVEEGLVFDVNSLYPYVLETCFLPYGEPIFFEGEYTHDKCYPMYVQCFSCIFDIKPGYLPTVQLKNSARFCPTEYLTSSDGDEITLYMTNVDLGLFLDHYDVKCMHYISGWKFRCSNNMFKPFVEYWTEKKIYADEEGNKGMRFICKRILNTLYGKFGLNPKLRSKKVEYEIDEDIDLIRYKNTDWEMRDPVYIPIAVFVTSWARNKTIRTAQSLIDRFVYSDTDSIHILGTEIPNNIEVDPYLLGAWKCESHFTRARFLRSKCYVEEIDGELKVTCAGLPKRCHSQVSWENFRIGQSYEGKLAMKHVSGGIVLVPTEFTIKEG